MIPKFIQKFFSFIGGLIKKVTPEVKHVVSVGIALVENFKKFADSEAADVLTALIPGIADDAAKEVIRRVLPSILKELHLIQDVLDSKEIADAIIKINEMGDVGKAIINHGIASAINNELSENIGSLSQAFITTEVVYKAEKEKIN